MDLPVLTRPLLSFSLIICIVAVTAQASNGATVQNSSGLYTASPWPEGTHIRVSPIRATKWIVPGSDVRLACGVHTGGRHPMPRPTVEWRAGVRDRVVVHIDERVSATGQLMQRSPSGGWISIIRIQNFTDQDYGTYRCQMTSGNSTQVDSVVLGNKNRNFLFKLGAPNRHYIAKYGAEVDVDCEAADETLGVMCLAFKMRAIMNGDDLGQACLGSDPTSLSDRFNYTAAKRRYKLRATENNTGEWRCVVFRRLSYLGRYSPAKTPYADFNVLIEEIAPTEPAIVLNQAAPDGSIVPLPHVFVPITSGNASSYKLVYVKDLDRIRDVKCVTDSVVYPTPEMQLTYYYNSTHFPVMVRKGRSITFPLPALPTIRSDPTELRRGQWVTCTANNSLGTESATYTIRQAEPLNLRVVGVTTSESSISTRNITIIAHLLGAPVGSIRSCFKPHYVPDRRFLNRHSKACTDYHPSSTAVTAVQMGSYGKTQILFSWTTGLREVVVPYGKAVWTVTNVNATANESINGKDRFYLRISNVFDSSAKHGKFIVRYNEAVAAGHEFEGEVVN